MRREGFLRRISIDPMVCLDQPVFRGTRIRVSPIVDDLAGGEPGRIRVHEGQTAPERS